MGQQANVPASVGCGSIWFFFVCHSPSTGALNFGSGATPAKGEIGSKGTYLKV